MISSVRGEVLGLGLDHAVVEVGGVGLAVQATPNTLARLRRGQQARLDTALVVREDSLTLFGFAEEDEKQTFEMLLTASGVGPKLAQAMLAVHAPDELRRAVASDDVKTLTRVPGIGQKGAQRIILELKDRIGSPVGASTSRGGPLTPTAAWESQVQTGLVGLGWSAREAERAVASVTSHAETMPEPDVARLLRLALQTLSKA